MSAAKFKLGPGDMAQLPFDFPVLNSQAVEDLAVGDSNRDAVRLVDSWPDWAQHVLVLSGPSASGKTHLARVFQKRADALWLDAADLLNSDASRVFGRALVVDDADRVEDEDQLFHLFNLAREKDGYLLLTARSLPAQWGLELPDLSSRLIAAPSVAINLPDESLLAAVMIKQFTDRQVSVDENVVAFLLPRMERSFAAVREMVERLDRKSMENKKKITVPLAKSVLEEDMLLF